MKNTSSAYSTGDEGRLCQFTVESSYSTYCMMKRSAYKGELRGETSEE